MFEVFLISVVVIYVGYSLLLRNKNQSSAKHAHDTHKKNVRILSSTFYIII